MQKEISLKGQNDKNYNKNIYDKINKLIENDSTLNWINDIFEMNYLEFLKNFILIIMKKILLFQKKLNHLMIYLKKIKMITK